MNQSLKEKIQVILGNIKTGLAAMRTRISKAVDFRSKRFWMIFFGATLGLVFVGFGVLVVVFAWYSKDLPSPTRVVRREGYASRIYDRNGELLYDVFRDAKRTPVEWKDIPENLKKATIAVEDKDFYKHKGFDPLTPFRMVKNVFYFKKLTGGSTLTQQLTRIVLLSTERSVNRKIREFILAVQIEAKYKKDDILLMYLNEAPYGGSAWGIGSASEQYFGKPVRELNLAESAILAGMPQLPSVYSPFSKTPTAYISRTNHVLDRMVEDGYIKPEDKETAMAEVSSYKFRSNKNTIAAPHFVLWVKEELSKKYGEEVVEGGGLKITTSLDLKLQEEIEKIISEEVDKGEKYGFSNGASVVLDPTNGQVLAMVGSRDYYTDKTDGKFNVTTQGLRQPGSAIKPITYLTAMRKGWSPSSMIVDAPVTFPGGPGAKDYSPQNYNGKFNGPMSFRAALGNSINTTAVKLLATVGLENMLKQAFDMGLTTLEPTPKNLQRFGLAVTLGGAEVRMIDLASAYSSFANGGKKVDAIGVLKVEDPNGRVLEQFNQIEGKQVMTPQEAFLISNILSDNSARELTFGAQNGLIIPNYQVAVKTGTTNDKRDNWAIGWTPNLLVASWVGNNDNSPMTKVASGISGATPIWRRIMLASLPKRDKQDFSIPEKIVQVDVDRLSGYPAHDGYTTRSDYFIDSMVPKVSDPIHMKLKVCKGSFGLATPEDLATNNYDEKEYIRLKEEDPISKDGRNRWQEGIDSWINSQTDKDKYNPPNDYCRQDGMVDVAIDSPAHESTVGNTFDVKIKTTSAKKITEVKLWVDGKEQKTWDERPFEMSITLSNGTHVIKVRATDRDGSSAEREAKIGVNVPWNWQPTPTGLPSATPTPMSALPSPTTIVPTVTVLPSPTGP